jgi:hypothetical protein
MNESNQAVKNIDIMESNEIMRRQIFEIIKNQIRNNDPVETNLTYKRLIKLGYADFVTKQLIGQCIAVELFNIMKYQKPFDKERYIQSTSKKIIMSLI